MEAVFNLQMNFPIKISHASDLFYLKKKGN